MKRRRRRSHATPAPDQGRVRARSAEPRRGESEGTRRAGDEEGEGRGGEGKVEGKGRGEEGMRRWGTRRWEGEEGRFSCGGMLLFSVFWLMDKNTHTSRPGKRHKPCCHAPKKTHTSYTHACTHSHDTHARTHTNPHTHTHIDTHVCNT